MLVPAYVLQVLQRNGSLHSAVVAPPVVNNELMAPTSDAQVPRIQIHVSVTNAGMNIQFQADNEFLNGLLIAEPLSYVPITNFLSSSIMPSLATIGPWAHGYGMRPTSLDIHLSLSDFEGSVQVTSCISQGEADGTVTSTVQIWSIDREEVQALSDETQTVMLHADIQVVAFSETSKDTVAGDITETLAGSSRAGAQGKRSKNKAPVSIASVHRSSRSNKYDGFKVHQVSDSKAKTSKVKPRVVPSALTIREVDDVEQIPPPTPVRVIQQISAVLCAIPTEELTDEALMASQEEEPLAST